MKFSIVTISFNQSKFIKHAIRSVTAQDYHDIEYVVVDPGSTDGSREIIERYYTKIDKVIFEPDEGPGQGLNKGFAQATGEIYGYINADDYYEPGTFGHVADLFQNDSSIDVVCGAIRIIGADGTARLRKRICDCFDFKKFAAGAYTYCQQATFFRRRAFELTDGFNEKNKTCWDMELIVDMALSGSSFKTTNKVLGNFRIHDSSITGSGQMTKQYIRDYGSIRNKIRLKGIRLYSPFIDKLVKFIYKCNLRRHLSYLTVK
jgi:glycosyltransferase involved in cell wall biosynthesis